MLPFLSRKMIPIVFTINCENIENSKYHLCILWLYYGSLLVADIVLIIIVLVGFHFGNQVISCTIYDYTALNSLVFF